MAFLVKLSSLLLPVSLEESRSGIPGGGGMTATEISAVPSPVLFEAMMVCVVVVSRDRSIEGINYLS